MWYHATNNEPEDEEGFPPNADIITPTESMLKGFQERQAWFDSVVFQREDHAAACRHLNIPNPGYPE